ncbi:MAG TPA: hypothetical protein K8V00_03465 [Ligilactobacillus acidipiscis]|uniref:Uncharacterized protein n=1 Tax=Ligilactobacillus acidipiscis TaxID=89059 RepID=A0A921F9J1_9LACO|nr:hypothetical protein [Ligilactobacillus acidipiscis]
MEKAKKRNKVSEYFRTVLYQIGLTPRRAVNSMIFLLVFSSLASICYILLLAGKSGTAFQTFLGSNPQSAVMFIISTVDFGLGYVLWNKKEELITRRKNFQAFSTFLLFSQLIVGNLVCVILAGISLYVSSQVKNDEGKYLSGAEITLFSISGLVYIFCVIILLRLR